MFAAPTNPGHRKEYKRGERLPYTLAVHRGKGENPHAHLMISERSNDGIERSREQWFKRYNSKDPEKGGARKSMATRPKDWADHANQALARVGSRERITGASLEQQYRDALETGDDRAAARLEYREPGVHMGPHNVARAEHGVVLERTRSGVEPIMANVLDRVKAAEAKYTAMGETTEKLESTLKNFKGTADLCYAAMRELHREIKKDQADERWAFWRFVSVVETVDFTMAFLGNFLREGAWWGS